VEFGGIAKHRPGLAIDFDGKMNVRRKGRLYEFGGVRNQLAQIHFDMLSFGAARKGQQLPDLISAVFCAVFHGRDDGTAFEVVCLFPEDTHGGKNGRK
jgi:hypothetical protein